MDDGFGGGGFSDFFKTFFGAGFAGDRTQSRQRRSIKGRDYKTTLSLTLLEAYQGTERMIEIDGSRIKVKVGKGVADGQRLRVKGKGGRGPAGGQSGDLYLLISILPDPRFKRKQTDLYTTVDIDLYTAVLGGKLKVETLKGPVNIAIPQGTQSTKSFRLRNMGMPKYRQSGVFGDMFVKIHVEIPSKLSPEQKSMFEKLRKLK